MDAIGCCDLHTHTTASDGSDRPEDLIRLAAAAGLKAVAITDHDTVSGLDSAIEAGHKAGIEVLPGVELSVNANIAKGDMHMLGYYIDADSASLNEVLERVQAARAKRNPLILERLAQMGKPLSLKELEDMSGGGQIGRPHIAKAMVRHGYVGSTGEAFARFLKKGASAYVPKSILSPKEAVDAIHAAGGLAVLAHPISLACEDEAGFDALVGRLASKGLDGMECYYSEHSLDFTKTCLAIASKYGLVATGGSDYHGSAKPQIAIGRGRGGLCVPYDCVEALKARLKRL
ncbi:MAG: PHP domain-containing protein [Dissulfurimicrobium sp.]|uniref:PHP domain-containing protein n=1 Tax=Dissulfurimicrobium TaxID=1769732 RepID=UPI001EDB75C1|nr:PHP domain-containing protein [Dissulfurimicrobium hydrothermale]UKL13873.1 PHP domain-containing protein [Dissulfurimicrobium hydrothermale]